MFMLNCGLKFYFSTIFGFMQKKSYKKKYLKKLMIQVRFCSNEMKML